MVFGILNTPTAGSDAKFTNAVATGTYLTYTLNSTGRDWINLDAPTVLCLRSWHDSADVELDTYGTSGGGHSVVRFHSDGSNGPVLEVTYVELIPGSNPGSQATERSFAYDKLGNITGFQIGTSSTSTYTYSHDTAGHYENPHAVSSIAGQALTYDTNGNVLSDGTRTLVWNYKNQLTEAGVGGATTTYGYDHSGRRVRKTTEASDHLFVSALYDLKDGDATKHIFLPDGTLIASVEGSGASAELLYKHLDHLGSTRVVTNIDGMIEQVLDYHPFGEERINENYGALETRDTYTGHELDDETELLYMQTRYQNPGTMRFLSQDPASRLNPEKFFLDPQQLNMYSYVANSPIMYYDPTGEELEDWFDVVTGILTFGLLGGAKQVGEDADPEYSSVEGAVEDVFGEDIQEKFVAPFLIFAGEMAFGNKGKKVYEIAKGGGKHAGFLKNYASRSIEEISKSANSLQKQIRTHVDKIENPAKYRRNWADYSAKQKERIINHWQQEIDNFGEQIEVLKGIVKDK